MLRYESSTDKQLAGDKGLFGHNQVRRRMSTDDLILCGVMWAQHAWVDACEELFRALQSDEPDAVSLASAFS